MTLGSFPTFIEDQVRLGTVKIIYRSLCTVTCNGQGQRVFDRQQVAAYAAGGQDLFSDYAVLFAREQRAEGSDYVTQRYLTNLTGQIPALNVGVWQRDRRDHALLAQVRADERAASKARLQSTPTLIFIGPKRKRPAAGSDALKWLHCDGLNWLHLVSDGRLTVRGSSSSSGRRQREWDPGWSSSSRSDGIVIGRVCRCGRSRSGMGFIAGR